MFADGDPWRAQGERGLPHDAGEAGRSWQHGGRPRRDSSLHGGWRRKTAHSLLSWEPEGDCKSSCAVWALQVLLFVDCLTHGAARRSNPGVRRTIWHRSDSEPPPLLCLVTSWPEPLLTLRCRSYTMAWSRLRWGYTPSTELCERLAAGTPPPPSSPACPRVLSRLGFSKRRVQNRPKPAPCLHRRPALRADAAHRTSRGSGRGVRGGGAVSAAAPFAHSLFFKKLVHRWGSAYFAAEAEAAEAEADE